jgi:hypothetical protein
VIPWNAALLFARVRRGVALSFRDQLSRGGGLSSASTKRRVDASINSGLFMKQGTRSNGGEKLRLVLVDLSKNKCDFRVIVPDPSTFFEDGKEKSSPNAAACHLRDPVEFVIRNCFCPSVMQKIAFCIKTRRRLLTNLLIRGKVVPQ